MQRHLLAPALAIAFACSSVASEFIADIEYGVADGESLRLDVSVPDGEGPFPVAFLVHGGGWGSGDKSGAEKPNSGADISPWFQPLTDANFVWVSINYRLAPQYRWPACKNDTLTALAWVNENIAAYKGAPDRVAVFGHSAGGQLAMFTAHANEDIRPEVIVGCAAVTSLVQDLEIRGGLSISLQNLFDRPKEVTPVSLALLEANSPINLLKARGPDYLLIHGDADRTVPIEQSIDFQNRLHELNTRCDLLILPGAGHRLTEWSKHDPHWQEKMVSWVRDSLNKAAAEQ
ncbi:alpha/beta hydrolase [Pelagicoccus enzymogenes]|uniref:alpha/beta hydrolase n=1 Tax=Pelagicoccus enzymogenes TaxID=2773457 RepID=UPI00280FDEDD|nr:alpha/beta hydrolase [Pelagicoccus enzymogenes]MDQ8199966.1 alpha/beta hydrolase [Pelagicoccus enzymogenes]